MKVKKWIALVLVSCLLCGLCGCNALDEMRRNQAFYQSNGTVLWQGSTYKRLTVPVLLSPEWNRETIIYLTEPDVPVLLSTSVMNAMLFVSEDGRFIMEYTNPDRVYCREDCFDEIQKRLFEAFKPEVYCYFYYTEDPATGEYEEQIYKLTEEQVEAVGLVRNTIEPTVVGYYEKPQGSISVQLYACSEDLLLRQSTMEIVAAGAGYTLLVHRSQDKQAFPVPEGLKDTFAGIMEAYANKGVTDLPAVEEAIT